MRKDGAIVDPFAPDALNTCGPASDKSLWNTPVAFAPGGLIAAGFSDEVPDWFWLIEVLQVKYLNNIIEQDHRFIKKLTRQKKGFKSFNSASATLEGIEVAHMIRKQQFEMSGQSAFQQFEALAG